MDLRRSTWIGGLVTVALLGSLLEAWGNGHERVAPDRGEAEPFVTVRAKRLESSRKLPPVRVRLRTAPSSVTMCPAVAYVPYRLPDSKSVVPLKIALAAAPSTVPSDQPVGTALVADPSSNGQLVITVEETTQTHLTEFLHSLPPERRTTVESGVGIEIEGVLPLDVKHPVAHGTCVEIDVTGIVPSGGMKK